MADKSKLILLQNVKVQGVEYIKIMQINIHHSANEYAKATLNLIVDEKKS